mmetsp:Transcript_86760/g.260492  ORF Transcript_86760/g.260492 Transcript_86760/m.260492 type:complete len:137 (+) Transcript_86760:622-1032(+)|eukprot:2761689-Prymnesium_polylepis.1
MRDRTQTALPQAASTQQSMSAPPPQQPQKTGPQPPESAHDEQLSLSRRLPLPRPENERQPVMDSESVRPDGAGTAQQSTCKQPSQSLARAQRAANRHQVKKGIQATQVARQPPRLVDPHDTGFQPLPAQHDKAASP